MLRFLATALVLAAVGTPAIGQSAPADGAPVNPAIVASPWPTYHGGSARQASTALRGPASRSPDVTVSSFVAEAGIPFGTSPWHILSDTRYANSASARTLWGASLKYLYKYEIDGDVFRYVDSFKLNELPFFIGWNFFALADGRVVVPDPSGLRVGEHRTGPCFGRHPSLLIFRDGPTSGSPIRCVGKFEFTPDRLERACGFRRTVFGTTAVGIDVLYTGEIAARLRRDVGRGPNRRKETWIAILDNALSRIIACAKVADGTTSNGVPLEPRDGGSSVFYIATETELVAMTWNPETGTLRRDAAVKAHFRSRTGTTPTLLGFGEDRWIIAVDGRCAVENVFTGAISCDDDDRSASKLVAFPLPLGSGPAVRTDLPDFIDTVENSPAVAGNDIVVTNYTGYRPDGERDGRPDRATGIVKLSWDPSERRFRIDWQNADTQISGVPTISTGANRVYGSGAEPDGQTYFYGFRLRDDSTGIGGELVTRVRVGPSEETRRGAKDGVFDAGGNIVISDDGSAIWPGGESLIRIRDRVEPGPR